MDICKYLCKTSIVLVSYKWSALSLEPGLVLVHILDTRPLNFSQSLINFAAREALSYGSCRERNCESCLQ